jgi:hypothetical protein
MSKFFALALAGIVSSSFQGRVVEARDTHRVVQDLSEREQNVIAIQANHALLKSVRDELFNGEGGISKLSEIFADKALNWEDKWAILRLQLKALNESYSENQKAAFLVEISALNQAFEEMRSLQSKVSDVASVGRTRLSGRTAMPYNSTEFAQEAKSLELEFTSLNEAFVKTDQVVKDKAEELGHMQGKVLDVSEALAKRDSLSAASRELNEALDAFAQFIIVEKVAGPMIESIPLWQDRCPLNVISQWARKV